MKGLRYIAVLLIACQLFPLNLQAKSSSPQSVAVVSVKDGQSDIESEQLARLLGDRLSLKRDMHVVENKSVDRVLGYYDRANDQMKNRVDGLLAQAKEHYYKLNYIGAKSITNEAISLIEGKPGGVGDYGALLLDAYVTLGIIFRSMGNTVEARQAFLKALRLDPSFILDSRAFSPSMIELFKMTRDSFERLPKGNIKVTSKPKAAEVYLNGVLKGVAPLKLEDLPEGSYHIKIAANKYDAVRRVVTVKAGRTVNVRDRIRWAGGRQLREAADSYVVGQDSLSQVEDALKIAKRLNVDKVLVVDVDLVSGGGGLAMARIVDAEYGSAYKPVDLVVGRSFGVEKISATIADRISAQARVDIARNPIKYADPPGLGSHELMGKKKRRRVSNGLLFGIIGGVLAAGLGAGLAAAFAGGSSGGGGTGSVNVEFR